MAGGSPSLIFLHSGVVLENVYTNQQPLEISGHGLSSAPLTVVLDCR